MKPAGFERRAAAVVQGRFEEADGAAAEAGEFGAGDASQHSGFLAGSELRDGFDVSAVFVAEGRVIKEVGHGSETLAG